jgi:hypothetical protein
LGRYQEAALECAAIILRQLAADIGIDKIRFDAFDGAQEIPIGKGPIFHPDLFFFGQVSEQILDQQQLVNAF